MSGCLPDSKRSNSPRPMAALPPCGPVGRGFGSELTIFSMKVPAGAAVESIGLREMKHEINAWIELFGVPVLIVL